MPINGELITPSSANCSDPCKLGASGTGDKVHCLAIIKSLVRRCFHYWVGHAPPGPPCWTGFVQTKLMAMRYCLDFTTLSLTSGGDLSSSNTSYKYVLDSLSTDTYIGNFLHIELVKQWSKRWHNKSRFLCFFFVIYIKDLCRSWNTLIEQSYM